MRSGGNPGGSHPRTPPGRTVTCPDLVAGCTLGPGVWTWTLPKSLSGRLTVIMTGGAGEAAAGAADPGAVC